VCKIGLIAEEMYHFCTVINSVSVSSMDIELSHHWWDLSVRTRVDGFCGL